VKPIYLPLSPTWLGDHSQGNVQRKAGVRVLQLLHLHPWKNILHIRYLDQPDIAAFVSRKENHEVRHLGALKPHLGRLVPRLQGDIATHGFTCGV
jgi:hypothetical protein